MPMSGSVATWGMYCIFVRFEGLYVSDALGKNCR